MKRVFAIALLAVAAFVPQASAQQAPAPAASVVRASAARRQSREGGCQPAHASTGSRGQASTSVRVIAAWG